MASLAPLPDAIGSTLPELLARAVTRYGARTAARAPSRGELPTISYEELDRRSALLRDELTPSLQHGEFVPLCGHNSIEWIVALFALLRTGAVPVPVNPDADAATLAGILDELAPSTVVGDARALARVRGRAVRAIDLDRIDAPPTAARAAGRDAVVAPDELALMLYTTGTTGRPKGVMLSHRNLVSNVAGVIDAVTLGTDDVVLVVLPLYHSFPLTAGCLAAIAAGVRIELESRPTRLAARLAEARPTLLIGVPALYEVLLDRVSRRARSRGARLYLASAGWLNRLLIRRLGVNAGRVLFRPLQRALGGRLRYAIAGGARLSPDVQREAFVLGLPLMQGFGLSEASPVVAVQRFDARRFWRSRYYWDRAGSCGLPLAGVTLGIEPFAGAEPGVGEIVVDGPNVMLGYYRRDEETREALRGGRLHTGDLGSIDGEGELWIRGRIGLAVSTPRGKIAHLERIEDAIAHAPSVQQVVVVAEHAPEWRLVAVVYPSAEAAAAGDDAPAIAARVRAACMDACRGLEPHERIDAVRLTDEPLPATALGKIRRKELPEDYRFDLNRWRATRAAFREPQE